MRIIQKSIALAGSAVLAAGMLVGCSSGGDTQSGSAASGTDSGSGKAKVTIGVAVPNQEAPFFNGIRQAIEAEAANATDPEVEIVTVDAKDNADTQVSQIQDLITRNVDAIVYIPAGATAASVPVRTAKAQGIPVVTVDRNPEDAPGDTFIATDSEGAAKTLGDWVVEQTKGEGSLGVIQGQIGTTPEIARATGFDAAIDASNIKKTAEQASNAWHRDEGFDIAQDMLQANPDINIMFGRADALALGAAQAARGMNRDDILIVGFDGDPDGLEGVRDGVIDATICQQTNLMGKIALSSAIDLINGKELPAEQLQEGLLATPDTVEEFIANHP